MRSAHVRSRLTVLLAVAGLAAFNKPVHAQDDPHTVQPERPSVATHAFTVAPGWLEVEVGGEHDRRDGESQGTSLPFAAKIGLAPRLQLSVLGGLERAPGGGTSL